MLEDLVSDHPLFSVLPRGGLQELILVSDQLVATTFLNSQAYKMAYRRHTAGGNPAMD